jgi:hypothetical protein
MHFKRNAPHLQIAQCRGVGGVARDSGRRGRVIPSNPCLRAWRSAGAEPSAAR